MTNSQGLDPSEEELSAASDLIEGGHYRAAASRAFYAAFYAVAEVLRVRGEEPRTHSGVVRRFQVLVRSPEGVDPEVGRAYARLENLRGRADYRSLHSRMSDVDARRALEDANLVVEACRPLLQRGVEDD